MKRLAILILLATLLALSGGVKHPAPVETAAPTDSPVSFVAVTVFVDPHGKPLACYQVKVVVTAGDAKLVGVEGGESSAFNKAPYYDPHALQGNQIVIGAYSLDPNLPAHNTRVATLMFRVAGNVLPHYEATLDVAGTTDATPIDATVLLLPSAPPGWAIATSSITHGDAR